MVACDFFTAETVCGFVIANLGEISPVGSLAPRRADGATSHRDSHVPIHRYRRLDPASARAGTRLPLCRQTICRSCATRLAREAAWRSGQRGTRFFAVFPSATDAVAAAVQAQRGMSDHGWSHGRSLRVRMGVRIDVGECLPTNPSGSASAMTP
jgi:hypothetical protein